MCLRNQKLQTNRGWGRSLLTELTALGWIVDYFLITSFTWILFLCWLIPFQIFYVKLSKEQFWKWLKIGTICEFAFTYPIAKAVIFVGPIITNWASVLP